MFLTFNLTKKLAIFHLDINECKLPHPPCPAYLCENTVGGYKCGGVSGDPVNLTPRPDDGENRCPSGFALGIHGECEGRKDTSRSWKELVLDCEPVLQRC